VRIGLIGAGLIGRERLQAVQQLRQRGRDISICGILDPNLPGLAELASKFQAPIRNSAEELFDYRPDWIFIATPHDTAADLGIQSLGRGFQVLIEKPLGRSLAEAERILAAQVSPGQLWAGFNYRFYRGIAALIDDARSGKFGPLVSIRIELGHGCSPDITKGWKLDPVRAGGGCLIDPGIHLLDLCRLLSPAYLRVRGGWSWQGFWNTGVEEECRLHLDAGSFLIELDISIVRWRSTFRMEAHGTKGYGIVTGRNRSYGKQRYVRGKRWGWQSGVSQAESEELVLETNGDEVFADEMDALLFGAATNPLPPCSSREALEAMELLEQCRDAALTHRLEGCLA
jgi:predicted dehydrogenase